MAKNCNFIDKLRESGLRPTKQRVIICEVLFNKEKTFHFTINDLSKKISEELNKKISLNEVLKSIKKRDKSDYNRKISPLKRTKDQHLISSESESIRSCFIKIKKIMDRKIKA